MHGTLNVKFVKLVLWILSFRNNVRIHINKIINRVVFDCILIIVYNSIHHDGDDSPECALHFIYQTQNYYGVVTTYLNNTTEIICFGGNYPHILYFKIVYNLTVCPKYGTRNVILYVITETEKCVLGRSGLLCTRLRLRKIEST